MKIKSYRMIMGAMAVLLCMAGIAQGQMILISDVINNRVGAYNASTGATINGSFISVGTSNPRGIVYGDGYIYVTNTGNNTIGKYNATTGEVVDADFITTAYIPWGITYSNGSLFVSNYNDADPTAGFVSKYNAFTGAVVPGFQINPMAVPGLLTVYNGDLYVPGTNGVIGVYSESGAAIDASFITGLSNPIGMAIVGGSIFVAQNGSGSISQFDLATGDAINLNFITGLNSPVGMAVNANGNLLIAEIYGNVFEYDTAGVNVHGAGVPWFNAGDLVIDVIVTPVPEPGTSALLGLGLLFGAVSLCNKYRKVSSRL